MAVIYKLNIISWLLSKLLIKIDYISLPNIILNKSVVPEFIQSSANPNLIINYVQQLINDKKLRDSTSLKLHSINQMLGEPGASDRAANKILNG